MMDLKYLCKLYDRRVALAMIPFLQERLEYLSDEMVKPQNDRNYLENQYK